VLNLIDIDVLRDSIGLRSIIFVLRDRLLCQVERYVLIIIKKIIICPIAIEIAWDRL